MKLVWKLAIPQMCIVICVGLASFVVVNASLNSLREQYAKVVVENRFQRIARAIETRGREAVSLTSMFVCLPSVMRAYEMALDGNIDDAYSPQVQAARELLRKELAPMLDSYHKQQGKKLQLHFHLPNVRSLVRLWRDKQTRIQGEWLDVSDDLIAFRPTIVEVLKSGKTVMGIELGSGGFAIRGVVPVNAPDGRLLGTAEVLHDLQPVLDAVREEGSIELILFVNKERITLATAGSNPAAIATDLQDPAKNPHKGDFVRVTTPKDAVHDALITPELLSRGKDGQVIEHFGSLALAALPMHDYRGTQLGVLVCAMNTADATRLVHTAMITVALMLAAMVIAPSLSLLLGLRVLVTGPLNMIKAKIQDIAEDRADLSEQIPSGQKDEIGALARWFNTLTAKLNVILLERQEMAHWYKSILDAIPFLISVQDTEMKWTFINAATEKMLGKKREDVVGLPCSTWDLGVCNTDNCAIACAKRGEQETRFSHRGASYQVDVAILRGLQGETTGFIELIQDITSMEYLVQQEVEAKAASHAKSDFLATMSHEIRTPMNAIIGMTAIGKTSNDLERTKYALSKIEDASTHLLGIINDILDMSKIEAGKLELSAEEFNFEKMLQRVVNVVSFRMDEKKQTFHLDIDKNLPLVLIGDDQRLAQVVTNLLGNAVKFTPVAGSVSLAAHFLNEKEGVCEMQIGVSDSGIGISPERQALLFQSFQQAESNTSRQFGGTGLGLSISKRIVEMMGGRIWVESELDKGATFAFTVRMKRGGSQEYEDVARKTHWNTLRILAIDDNPAISGYMKSFVERCGASCDTAACGAEALDAVRQNGSYDIYFIDWQMADTDALQLTKNLQAIEPDKHKAIIAMISATGWGEIEENAKQAGIDKFLQKPLFPSVIMDIINEFFGVVPQRIEEAPGTGQVIFQGNCILLAEDVEINREIVLSLLEPTLVEIDCAVNGAEAVRLFQNAPEKYRMIFMDVQMPEMDGYEATLRIRELDIPQAKTVPIVAMTANVFREDIAKCLEAGMNDHVGKPLDMHEVLEKLRQYLVAR